VLDDQLKFIRDRLLGLTLGGSLFFRRPIQVRTAGASRGGSDRKAERRIGQQGKPSHGELLSRYE
jgi:hypothetical protein